MKRLLSILVTCLVLIAIGVVAQRRPATEPEPSFDDTPMSRIDRMFSAANRGDMAAYVECFAGEELQAIRRSLDQESQSAAAESLRKTMSELRGWAVVDPPADAEGRTRCSLVVERIYTGRVDRQKFEMEQIAGQWKITRVEAAQSSQPPVPYGTHITGALEDKGEKDAPDQKDVQDRPDR